MSGEGREDRVHAGPCVRRPGAREGAVFTDWVFVCSLNKLLRLSVVDTHALPACAIRQSFQFGLRRLFPSVKSSLFGRGAPR